MSSSFSRFFSKMQKKSRIAGAMRGKTLKASPLGEAQRVEKPPSAREVPRRGGGREPCHSPKYFGQPYSSLPHRLRAEPPRRGGQGVSTPFFDSLGFPLGGSCPQGGLMRGGAVSITRQRDTARTLPLIRPRAGPRPPSPSGEGTLPNYFLLGTSTALPPM